MFVPLTNCENTSIPSPFETEEVNLNVSISVSNDVYVIVPLFLTLWNTLTAFVTSTSNFLVCPSTTFTVV